MFRSVLFNLTASMWMLFINIQAIERSHWNNWLLCNSELIDQRITQFDYRSSTGPSLGRWFDSETDGCRKQVGSRR
ncbi:Predicted esterase of the alpha/beta hydrolase fold [Pseudomonas syringae pv. actinidiae]|uniref:Predicted esterase of the alpha/beta hydrolase fold n=1 Tax=Pseudomonas syringae pv. actinidiae TaxID=103796 RepID=A0AAN4Q553_PSESF|nr:Predicted esterase of the alpha/beta hydrolase fold [Pseudomonas syringae pv. actinidiae]